MKVSKEVISLVDDWVCDGCPMDGSLEVAIQRLLDRSYGKPPVNRIPLDIVSD